MPAGDGAMTDMSAVGWSRGRHGRARADRPSRPGRHAGPRGREAVTIISAPAGSGKTSLLHTWAARPAQDHRTALMSIWPGQRDAQLFWLALPGTVRAAAGSAESPPAAPEFNGQAMVDKVLTELAASGGPSVLITDDLHQLSFRVRGERPGRSQGPPRHRHRARPRPSSPSTP